MNGGVWRTIRGARVFIPDGKSIEEVFADKGNIKKAGIIEDYDDVLDSLVGYSDEQKDDFIEAIEKFTGEDYLKARARETWYTDVMDRLDDAIEASDAKFSDDRMSLYRGIVLTEKQLGELSDLSEGDIIDQKGTSSWTTSSKIATDFSGKGQVIFRDVTEGTRNALSIQAISNVQDENEVLYSGRAKWQVNKISTVTYMDSYDNEVDVVEVEVREVK